MLRYCPLQNIRRALGELPRTLDETYEYILQGIHEEKWVYAHRIFQCLTVLSRPLRVEELADVFAIRGGRRHDWNSQIQSGLAPQRRRGSSAVYLLQSGRCR